MATYFGGRVIKRTLPLVGDFIGTGPGLEIYVVPAGRTAEVFFNAIVNVSGPFTLLITLESGSGESYKIIDNLSSDAEAFNDGIKPFRMSAGQKILVQDGTVGIDAVIDEYTAPA